MGRVAVCMRLDTVLKYSSPESQNKVSLVGILRLCMNRVMLFPPGQDSDEEGGWTYEYVPGAGDDEESWAEGLTPGLLYTHQEVSPPLFTHPVTEEAMLRSLLTIDHRSSWADLWP